MCSLDVREVPLVIEDIVLAEDKRGMSALRPYLPPDFCSQAARFIHTNAGTTFIVTGFYILRAGATETDGPPGALALGRALQSLGREVVYVSDCNTVPLLKAEAGDAAVIEFPIVGPEESEGFARSLLERYKPSVLVAIERCSVTRQGLYRNIHGVDITPYNARTDYLFTQHPATVGVGDGGNEIGMGNLAEAIHQVPTLPKDPAATHTSHLVISSVSNWGAYGLVAGLSLQEGRDLLPKPEEESQLIKRMVAMGAVDGVFAQPVCFVDSFSVEENLEVLGLLRGVLRKQGINSH